MSRTFESRPGGPWLRRLYWPVFDFESPRLPDGSVDVRALCCSWDNAFNQGASDKPSRITEEDE